MDTETKQDKVEVEEEKQVETEEEPEVEAKAEEGEGEKEETPEAKKPETETIPKYRLDETLSKYNELQEQHRKALAYIQAFTAQATQPKPEPVTPDDRLARMEQAVNQMYNLIESQRTQEAEADRTLIAFEAEMSQRPHLKNYSKRIWQQIAVAPRGTAVNEVFDDFDTFVKSVKTEAKKETVKPKQDLKGYVSPSIRGSPPTTMKALDKLKEKKGEDFWDDVQEQFAGHMRASKSARGEE